MAKFRLMRGCLPVDGPAAEKTGFVKGDVLSAAFVSQLGDKRLSSLMAEGIVETVGDDASDSAPRSLLEGAL